MELLTSGQAAQVLKLSAQRVVQLARQGTLREAARVGLQGTRLFLASDVRRLSQERERPQPSE